MVIAAGDMREHTVTVTDETVRDYATVTGDTNPLHLNEDYASETFFGERIIHGMLAMGFVSAALAKFDGVVIYLNQDVEFENPIAIGATVTASCTVLETTGTGEYLVETLVVDEDDGTVYLTGTANIRITDEPSVSD